MSTTPNGPIAMSDVNTALNAGSTIKITFNDSLVRKLQVAINGVQSGTPTASGTSISLGSLRNKIGPDPYGTYQTQYCTGTTLTQTFSNGSYGTYQNQILNSPSCRPAPNITNTGNQLNYVFNPAKVTGYIAGQTDAILTVNSGQYYYSDSTSTPAITVSGWAAGDTVKIVNNGYIMGKGGNGYSQRTVAPYGGISATSGGPAISLSFNTTIDNTNTSAYIGGGGGGGAGGWGGGGGAGGGAGGTGGSDPWAYGGAGGAPGQVGANGGTAGEATDIGTVYFGGGGGGGRIFPGTGGAGASGSPNITGGYGGGAGGGGGTWDTSSGAAGGSAGNPGVTATSYAGGGGGGGWGASGGVNSGGQGGSAGAGGKAVQKNGYTVTFVNGNTTRVYGAVA